MPTANTLIKRNPRLTLSEKANMEKNMKAKLLYENSLGIIIPYYNASKEIVKVVAKIPSYIDAVIIVDDDSKEILPKKEISKALNDHTTCHFLKNEKNLGVGGATKKGFVFAITKKIDFLIKVDADNQMDLNYLPQLLEPLVTNQTLVSKGNRFRDFRALQKMPVPRKMGNLILSFLVKLATGYWHNFDPTNGFVACNSLVLKNMDLNKLSDRYFFETSMLSQFYFQKIAIKDVAMPAIYRNEKSNMNLFKMVFVFSGNLTKTLVKRVLKDYFLYDFNVASVYILFGLPLFLFGIIFGSYTWVHYSFLKAFAPTGTIMIITLALILGFQLLLQAMQYDIFHAPKTDI
ncbi:glycosyltransferase family 2 protein [Flagellimonas allohymeniacidonis]|uniref:Glycosyltransferase family 2 protein n=1 Tax=Flagellimonas allohymeniacidonis TaxID=2517819 RepID=A0A4Q8Q8P6_9FLAO|nr:glycosyltransferase family 2 protein [Allomuricauda hymeniacidonis]TAI46602.1 glycosyltransferase family 2 protein [Allomuricauda hymeniacidonis]